MSSSVRNGMPSHFLDRVNGDDVGVVQRRRGAGLALEPFAPVGVARKLAGEDLERDAPLEPRVVGEVHLAHSPFPEHFDDLIVPEGGADHALVAPDGMRRNYTVELDSRDVYLMPTTIESGPTSGSTRVDENPASFIQPEQSAPV